MFEAKTIRQIGCPRKHRQYFNKVDVDYCFFFSNAKDLKLHFELIKKGTLKDTVLQRVRHLVSNEWSNKITDKFLKPFVAKKSDICCSDGCLFCNHRIIIPAVLQDQISAQLHNTHMGLVKVKGLARDYFWFSVWCMHITLMNPTSQKFVHGLCQMHPSRGCI